MIEQAAGRGDDEVDAGAQRAILRTGGDAAKHGRAGESGVIAEALEVFFDLERQLTRRREHEHARGLRTRRIARIFGVELRVEQALHDRQQERGGLARAGLRAADQVDAGQHVREHGALDRRGLFELMLREGAVQPRVEAEVGERDRRRIVRHGLERDRGRRLRARHHRRFGGT